MRTTFALILSLLLILPAAAQVAKAAQAADSGHMVDGQGRTTGTYTRQGDGVILRDRQGRTLGRMEQTPGGDVRATDRQGRRVDPAAVLPGASPQP
ncbi:hypothetical protein [Megalodesulfovibrio paquesii]